MTISKKEGLQVQERALVVHLCDGQGHNVRVEVTAGALSTGPGVAQLADLAPGAFCLRSGNLIHTPTSAGEWGLGFRVLANHSHYQDLCSLFVTGYTEEQKAANWDRPYTTATVLPIGSTEVVRETPGEGVLWAFPPRSDAFDADMGVHVFHIHLQLGTLRLQGVEGRCGGCPRKPPVHTPAHTSTRLFAPSDSERIGSAITLLLHVEVP